MTRKSNSPNSGSPLHAVALVGVLTALACAPTTTRERPIGAHEVLPARGPAEVAPVQLELLDADGAPLSKIEVVLFGVDSSFTDADGRVSFALPAWRETSPVIYVRATLPGGDSLHATIPRAALTEALTLQLPPGALGDAPLALAPEVSNASARAWFGVTAWLAERRGQWRAAESSEDKLAVWARVAEEIEASSDPLQRNLMIAAQFAIGRGEPELSRQGVAARALDELPLDDPAWAISPFALVSAAYDSGRWDEFKKLDMQISDHPQPEVAAMLTLERYVWAIDAGRWEQADAIWARWLARPELAETFIGSIVEDQGPTRRLAPGQELPELCFPTIDSETTGRQICTAEFEGLTVLELYAVWCEGCRESFPRIAGIFSALEGTGLQPSLVTVEVYNDLPVVSEFIATIDAPGEHGWVFTDDSEHVRNTLGLSSVPTMVLVGPDRRILASSPGLSTDNLEQQLRHWQATLTE